MALVCRRNTLNGTDEGHYRGTLWFRYEDGIVYKNIAS
jgi:hypothetical protein